MALEAEGNDSGLKPATAQTEATAAADASSAAAAAAASTVAAAGAEAMSAEQSKNGQPAPSISRPSSAAASVKPNHLMTAW